VGTGIHFSLACILPRWATFSSQSLAQNVLAMFPV
jgi:hypothetical protein